MPHFGGVQCPSFVVNNTPIVEVCNEDIPCPGKIQNRGFYTFWRRFCDAKSFVFIPVVITLERNVYEIAESARELEVCAVASSDIDCPINTPTTVSFGGLSNTAGLLSIYEVYLIYL